MYVHMYPTQVNCFWDLIFAEPLDKKDEALGSSKPRKQTVVGKIQLHAEAWGVRKLLSYVIRRLRSNGDFRAACFRISDDMVI